MYEIRKMLYQDFMNLIINPMWLFFSTLFPYLLILIVGYLTSAMYGEQITSYAYYTVTFLIYSALNTATIASNSFLEERIKAGNMRILYSPVDNRWLYLSKIIATFVFSSILHILVFFALSFTFSLSYGTHMGLLCVLLLSLELFAAAIGVLLCCILKSESSANQIISLVLNILAILGGVFFSLERFGGVIATVSALSPVKWVMDASFAIIYDDATQGGYITILMLLLSTLVILWGCKYTFHEENCL